MPNCTWAAKLAIQAGLDQEQATDTGLLLHNVVHPLRSTMRGSFAGCYGQQLANLVNSGMLNQSYIDRAAANALRQKFASGLFDT